MKPQAAEKKCSSSARPPFLNSGCSELGRVPTKDKQEPSAHDKAEAQQSLQMIGIRRLGLLALARFKKKIIATFFSK